MIFIGITGGIGSGKSLVCSFFAKKNVPIFYADESARSISEQPEVKEEIFRAFGSSIITADHTIDRKKLASIVFSEHGKLEHLNSIIHPRVFSDLDKWKETLSSSSRYALVEAALMFDSHMDEKVDYVLSVVADDQTKIKRVMERDKASRDSVESRMQNQMQEQELIELSDFILKNNGTETEVQSKVDFFHILFSTLTQRKEIQ